MKDLKDVIEGYRICNSTYGPMPVLCGRCPYELDDDCAEQLKEDVSYYLKRLEFLEKPTSEEQPRLFISESTGLVVGYNSAFGGFVHTASTKEDIHGCKGTDTGDDNL